jgi:AcrR family transcriptional regulator
MTVDSPHIRDNVVIMESLEPRRAYRMQARADAAAETGERILAAAAEVFWELPTDRISLPEVARRANVSVATVLRRFGDKDALMLAAAEREAIDVRRQREQAPEGDVPAAVVVLVAHYERHGEKVMKLLSEEHRVPGLEKYAAMGRSSHRLWCERVFASSLAGLGVVDRRRRLAELIAVCDVYTWKLLRQQSGLSRRQTELALIEMLTPLTGEF